MSTSDGRPALTPRGLGRATLARQGLLDRLHLDPVAATESIGGLQSQEPASPYIALWTRLSTFARNGDTLPTVLVDGQVAGLWWADPGPGGRTQITIEPFRPLDRASRRDLEIEAARLAAFVEPLDPVVYARYQHWRPAR